MQRKLGRTGRKVFPLGLGCMGMSWIYAESRRDDEHSIAVIRQARDAGVQLIDTAGLYGDGHNEELVGRALRGQRDDVVLATKGGLVVDDLAARRVHRDGRPETLRRQVDESLRRLDVEQIDLFYLHRVDPAVPIGESWEALSAVVDTGKVRWLGLSEVTIAQAESAHAIHPVTAIQSELSLWTRDPLGHGAEQGTGREQAEPTSRGGSAETSNGTSNSTSDGDLLAWTRDHGVSFVPFAPLGRGYLTGTLTPDGFEDGDFRATNPRFTPEAFARNRDITDEISRVASAHDATSAQVCLAWLLGLSENIIPIPGTRSSTHLRQNLRATQLALTDDEMRTLDGLPAPSGARYGAPPRPTTMQCRHRRQHRRRHRRHQRRRHRAAPPRFDSGGREPQRAPPR